MTQGIVPKEELAAAIEARRELGEELEPQVIDAFVERIERRLEQRLRNEPAVPPADVSRQAFVITLTTLGLSIPLLGIAAGTTGLPGVIAVCIALVLINLIARR